MTTMAETPMIKDRADINGLRALPFVRVPPSHGCHPLSQGDFIDDDIEPWLENARLRHVESVWTSGR
jgi:hypothetical protein